MNFVISHSFLLILAFAAFFALAAPHDDASHNHGPSTSTKAVSVSTVPASASGSAAPTGTPTAKKDDHHDHDHHDHDHHGHDGHDHAGHNHSHGPKKSSTASPSATGSAAPSGTPSAANAAQEKKNGAAAGFGGESFVLMAATGALVAAGAVMAL